jgi:hypothetical protein
MTKRFQRDAVVSDLSTCHELVSASVGEAELSTRDIVHWECQSSAHRALHSRHGNGGLTIHEAAWAYCDGAGADDAHHWSPTGGVALGSLVRWTAPNGISADGYRALASAASNGAPKGLRKTAGVRRT